MPSNPLSGSPLVNTVHEQIPRTSPTLLVALPDIPGKENASTNYNVVVVSPRTKLSTEDVSPASRAFVDALDRSGGRSTPSSRASDIPAYSDESYTALSNRIFWKPPRQLPKETLRDDQPTVRIVSAPDESINIAAVPFPHALCLSQTSAVQIAYDRNIRMGESRNSMVMCGQCGLPTCSNARESIRRA
jgi:hypothetical protein